MDFGNESWQRRRFLLTGAAGLTMGLAGCTSDDSSGSSGGDGGDGGSDGGSGGGSSDPTDTETETAESTPQSADVVVGELVEDDSIQMVVRSVDTTKSLGQFQEADEGNTFLVVRMAVKNTSDGFINFSGFWQARVKDSSNHVYNASFNVTDHPLSSDVLASGEVTRGDMVFEIPEGASGLRLQFDFQAFSLFDFSRVNVALEETANNIANLSQSLNIDVNSPGDRVSHGNVGVTLHGVRSTKQVGDYAEAEEGHEFIIPDIEVTNNSDEGLPVSTLLQMAMKDGTGFTYGSDLMATSQLDQKYSEGSDISPGESRRGEIAYEIALDASPVYWTFNFLDFNAEQKAFWEVKG